MNRFEAGLAGQSPSPFSKGRCRVETDAHSRWFNSVRKHRHDVLNMLQIAQGYLQMEKPQQALVSLRQLSEWLQSLSQLQGHMEPVGTRLFQVACMCPHVIFASLVQHRELQVSEMNVLAELWTSLEEMSAEWDVGYIEVRIETLRESEFTVFLHCPQGIVENVQANVELMSLCKTEGIVLVFQP